MPNIYGACNFSEAIILLTEGMITPHTTGHTTPMQSSEITYPEGKAGERYHRAALSGYGAGHME